MRGKAARIACPHMADRITPAHAGKSTATDLRPARQRDHPRPCGEKVGAAYSSAYCMGSPPPMRGKGADKLRITGDDRITPAHAGKRWARRTHPHTAWDHPRPCGEKLWV